jgi:RHS repeat-associated protein
VNRSKEHLKIKHCLLPRINKSILAIMNKIYSILIKSGFVALSLILGSHTLAQVPNLSYPTGTQMYVTGTAITPITPTNSGGAIGIYNTTTTIVRPGVLGNPFGIAVDALGNVYVSEADRNRISKILPSGEVTLLAGGVSAGYENNTGQNAKFNLPLGLAIDGSGNIYVADQGNHAIRKITPAGVVTTLAGYGVAGNTDGTGSGARFSSPSGVALDASGNVFVADYGNHRIRKITAGGVVSTLAGGTQGNVDATGTAARFNGPYGLVLDGVGNIYVAERENHKIRKINTSKQVTTLAGTGIAGSSNGAGNVAQFYLPAGVTIDGSGNLYVADQNNSLIRKVTPTGVVSTYAGSGTAGSLDGINAEFQNPWSITIDASGNVLVGDYGSNLIRKTGLGPAISISPNLPDGLIFSGTGQISGTPTMISPPTIYTITSANNSGSTTASVTLGVSSVPLNTVESQNSIITYVPRIATSDVIALQTESVQNVNQSRKYFDGLGRPSQIVSQQASPQKRDIVQHITYDQYGKESIKYNPYTLLEGTTSDGSFKTDATTKQAQFYNPATISTPDVMPTAFPYAQKVIERSPLNRMAEQGAQGDNWQLAGIAGTTNAGHTSKLDYLTNNPISPTLSNGYLLRKYSVSISAGVRTLVDNSNYPSTKLIVTVVKDENWTADKLHTTEEYKDTEGRLLLKRTFNQTTPPAIEVLSTYYVYDDYGNLCFVLPPAANPDNGSISTTALNDFCYQYEYDEKDWVVRKKVPGKGWEEMIYNAADRLVFSQDARQALASERSFVKYDGLGRIIMSGVETGHSATRTSVQANVNSQTGPLWERRDAGGYQGYTNLSYPTNVATMQPLVVNYYDTYTGIPNLPAYTAPLGASNRTNGLLTASKTVVINPDNTYGPSLWKIFYYDDKGRVIRTYIQHYKGGVADFKNYDEITNTYDFTNAVTNVIRHHYNVASLSLSTPVTAFKTQSSYTYDHTGRRTETWLSAANGAGILPPATMLNKLEYNEIGQLARKHQNFGDEVDGHDIIIGAESASFTGDKVVRASGSIVLKDGFTFTAEPGKTFLAIIKPALQTTSYAYNERGWLTQAVAPLLTYQLQYNAGSNPQYNGNITRMNYNANKGLAPGLRQFDYTYDAVDRLTQSASAGAALNEALTYDVMGNITSLTRNAIGSSYTYSGTQLTSVIGGVTRNYSYDANGNATSDGAGKTINYNLLNLPRNLTSGPTTLATYTYDATGQKLRATGTLGGAIDYVNGIIYDGSGNIQSIATEEGRIVNNGGTLRYNYDLKDHLGNSRVTFDKNNTTSVADIVQEDEYYAFGLRQPLYVSAVENRYLYNGKEVQKDLDKQYDYGARFYDPVVGRWTSIDPSAENDAVYSPYIYGFNNPMRFTDPDGRWPGPGPLSMGNPLYHIAEGFRQVFQGAGNAIDRAYVSLSTSIDTKITNAKTSLGFADLKVTSSLNVTNTTTVRTSLGDFMSMNSHNAPEGPLVRVTNTTTTSAQVKSEGSTTWRGVDIKESNTTNVGIESVSTTTELSAGKTIKGATVAGYVSDKHTSSNSTIKSQTDVGIKASISFEMKKLSSAITVGVKAGVTVRQD